MKKGQFISPEHLFTCENSMDPIHTVGKVPS
uniref:Uncharacterized protein n=1 Tax=Anguilla anguilla TaxID=7936 RepID=A0A0E9XFU8_ANGAN